MLAKYLRRIIAGSLYRDVTTCNKCERSDYGFDDYIPCEKHKDHITVHNVLTEGLGEK